MSEVVVLGQLARCRAEAARTGLGFTEAATNVLLAADALSSPAAFAVHHCHHVGTVWEPYEHLVHLSDVIVEGVVEDEWDVLVVTEPPRHGKTQLCARWTPAWFACRFRLRIGVATYEADLARSHGRYVRDILEAVGDFYGLSIRRDASAADRFEIVGEPDSGMWTAGAGGPITGKGYWLGVVDDPVKNAEDARSEVSRASKWEWWTTTWFTRREPTAKVILDQTAWHEDDMRAKVLAQRDASKEHAHRIRSVNMPALAEDDDELGREVGAPLCPERYPLAALESIRSSIGTPAWLALYQQRPQAAGGNIFRRQHFRYWSTTKDDKWYVLHADGREHPFMRDEARIATFVDLAYTRGKRSDYTVVGTFAIVNTNPNPSLLLIDGSRLKIESAEHAGLILEHWHAHRPMWVGVERVYSSASLLDPIKMQGVPIVELRPDKSKAARAETGAAMFEAGRVYLPRDAWWLDVWEEELLAFPNAAHDDVVDVISYACIELARGRLRGKPRTDREEDKPPVQRHLDRFVKTCKQRSTMDALRGVYGQT